MKEEWTFTNDSYPSSSPGIGLRRFKASLNAFLSTIVVYSFGNRFHALMALMDGIFCNVQFLITGMLNLLPSW